MVDSIPQLVAATPQLEEVLEQVEEASSMFSNPNPAIRSQGEAIFLHVRQSPVAVDFACYALSQTRDAYVLFQAFQAILDNLPSLSLDNTTQYVPSLSVLRDFLLAVIVARSAIEKTRAVRAAKSSNSSTQSWSDKRQYAWPKYAQSRAYQTFAAVQKRLIGLQVEAEQQRNGQTQKAIHVHTDYILHQMASFLTLPESWPENEERLHLAQSNFTVGVGVLNGLLDEIGTTYSRLDSEGSFQGKARSIDFSGLLPMQHRWCKAIVQTYVLPSLLNTAIHLLYSTLPGQKYTESFFLFPLLVSLCARIVGWSFVLEDPFAGLEGPVSVEKQTVLLQQEEVAEDAGDDDKDDGATNRMDRPLVRSIPPTHANFLSRDVISVLHLAYNYAESLEFQRTSEASFCIAELRKSFLDLASSRLTVQQEAERQAMMESKRCQLQCIKDIITQGSNSNGNEGSSNSRNHNGVYGNALLFTSQLFHCFLTSSDDRANLLAAVDVAVLIESLSYLTNLVFHFAFEPRQDSDEEDELVQLGDESVDNILGSWRTILPYTSDQAHDEASQTIRGVVFASVVRPYIELRLLNAFASNEQGDDIESDFGQEVQADVDKYEEQLITLASLARDADLTSCLGYLLEGCTSIVQELQHFYATGDQPALPLSTEEEKRIENVWEQAHWITLIVGHIIADQSKGEVAVLANEIAALPTDSQASIIHLVQSLGCTLLQLFSRPNSRVQSPRLTETLLWFNARWVPVYLLVDTTPLLSTQFNGQIGQDMLQFLLVRIQDCAQLWGSDADVVLQVAAAIKSFSLSEGVMQVLLTLPAFQSTVKAITEGLDVTPAKTHGPLISAIVGCIYTSSTLQTSELFFEYIKEAIEVRLSRIIHQPNFASTQVSQRSDTIANLLNSLDMLDGLASSVQPKSAGAVYDFLSRFFDTLIGLVQLYHERSEVVISIVRVYRTLIGSLDLGFGAQLHMITGLNTAVSSLLSHINEKSLLGDSPEMALEEDVPFEGLCLVIELLSDLMLASDNDAADLRLWFAPISLNQTSDVCLQGFSRITPLLTKDARSVAKVRRRFANLTSKLWISFPHRIVGIAMSATDEQSIALYQSCISALVISLSFVESNLLVDCFAAIRQLSMAVEKVVNMTDPSNIAPNVLDIITQSSTNILETVLNGILIEPLATSLFDVHLLATRSLLVSLASERMGGMNSLQLRMAEYCSNTRLSSEYGSQSNHTFKPEEEARKRSALGEVVVHLANLCLQGRNASMNSHQGRQDETHFLKEARNVAWEGRAKIRAG